MEADMQASGTAYVAGWLRGRYGAVEDCGVTAGHRRWRILRESQGPFEVSVSSDALERDRVQLREWLETLAEDAATAAPDLPGGYRVTASQGVTKAAAGAPHERVHAGG